MVAQKRSPRKFHEAFCLDAQAPVWMSDFSFKPIIEVKPGESVWGWDYAERRRKFIPAQVLDVFHTQAPVVKVTLESGAELICTPDHLWASAKATSSVSHELRYSVALEKNNFVRNAEGHLIGGSRHPSSLARVVSPRPLGVINPSYQRGYLHGVCDGDGAITYGWYLRPGKRCPSAELVRKVAIRMHQQNVESIDRCEMYAHELSLPVTRPAPSKDKQHTVNFSGPEALSFFYAPRKGDDDYWRGWLGGCFDAEGYGYTFAQYRTVNPATYDNITDALQRFGFDLRFSAEHIAYRGGRDEFVRFWNLARPAIQAKRFVINQNKGAVSGVMSNWTPDDVRTVENLDTRDVYCIKTETGNFVAYGYGSKNCEGHYDQYGWKADGRSPRADSELSQRLKHCMLQRSRKLAWPDQPPKIREVVRLDLEGGDTSLSGDETEKQFHAELDRILEKILPQLIDNVLEKGLLNGEKCIIWCKTHMAVAMIYDAIRKVVEDSEHTARLRQVKTRVWAVRGGNDEGGLTAKARFAIARDFRRHVGAAVLVSTSDSLPEAISLGPELVVVDGVETQYEGATVEHVAQPEFQPGLALQVEDRCYEKGVRGLTIYYYVPKGTLYERVVRKMIPRLEALEVLVGSSEATASIAALRGERLSWEDQLASLLDAMPDDVELDRGNGEE